MALLKRVGLALTQSSDQFVEQFLKIEISKYGENRIDDFIKLCMMRGWIVNRIDVENQIDIYNKAEEEIELYKEEKHESKDK